MKKQRLISRKDFATLAGVSPAAITNGCKTILAEAVAGRFVDSAHPDAVYYVAKRRSVTEGAPDPLYDRAVEFCIDSGNFTKTAIGKHLGIGVDRALRIQAAMYEAGIVPPSRRPRKPAPPPEPAEPKAKRKPSLKPRRPRKLAPSPEPAGRAPRGKEALKVKRRSGPPPELSNEEFEVPEAIEAFADMPLREVIEKFGTDTRFEMFLKALKTIEDINTRRVKNSAAIGELVTRSLVIKGVIDPFNAAHLKIMQDGAKSITTAVITKHEAGISSAEIEAHVSDILGTFIAPIKKKITRALRNAKT